MNDYLKATVGGVVAFAVLIGLIWGFEVLRMLVEQ